MDPLMVCMGLRLLEFDSAMTAPLITLLEHVQCLTALRPHPLRPRHSRLDCVCAREQEPGDPDGRGV